MQRSLIFKLIIIILFLVAFSLLVLTVLVRKQLIQVNDSKQPSVMLYEGQAPVLVDNSVPLYMQFGKRLDTAQAFTEVNAHDLKVEAINIEENNIGKIIMVSSSGKRISLPMVGLVGIKKRNSNSYDGVLVSNVSKHLVSGTSVNIKASFVGSYMTWSNEQIQDYYNNKSEIKNSEFYDAIMLSSSFRGKKRLSEYDVIKRFSKENVSFEKEEMLILWLEIL